MHERREFDPPVSAYDAGATSHRYADGGFNDADGAARVVQHGGDLFVDPGRSDGTDGGDPIGGAEDERGQLQWVHAQVD